jgi:arylsulfatase A-like enzyme
MNRRQFFSLAAAALPLSAQNRPARPNVVIIYTDDIGYGDVGCYGATLVKTPHIDSLAKQGLKFTDAHCSSATCTPSRYALLTGRYAFRQQGARVLPGDAPALIAPGTPTLASVLKQQGYHTAVVGKWHLGLGDGFVDWNKEISPGPREIGFDYSFLIPATGDRVPCVYVENQKVVGLDPADPIRVSFDKKVGDEPIGAEHPELLKVHPSHGHDRTIVNGVSRIGYMSGGKSARWVDEDMADVITKKAVDYINQHHAHPFFLHFNTHDIHVPRVPHKRFAGKTPMGPRGDAIAQLDWCVGQILATLQKHKLEKDTIVIFSSDNGPVIDDGYKDDAVEKLGAHKPAGPFRGGKYSNFEAGTRVPFLVRWPARIKPNTQSKALFGQLDLVATLAALTGANLPKGAAPDSENLLPAFLGQSQNGRDTLVEHAGALALRQGPWKYIEPSRGQRRNANTNTELGNDPSPQLYNLDTDPGETKNLAAGHPDKVRALAELLDKIKKSGA